MDIRRATTDDTELVARLGRETYLASYAHLNEEGTMSSYLEKTFSLEKTEKELRNPDSLIYILFSGEEPAALLKLNLPPSQTDLNTPGTMELQRIYVLEAFKGKGFGRELIEHTKREAVNHGCSSIWLSVWEKNPAALQFYMKMGFNEDGRRLFRMGEELQSDLVLRYLLNT